MLANWLANKRTQEIGSCYPPAIVQTIVQHEVSNPSALCFSRIEVRSICSDRGVHEKPGLDANPHCYSSDHEIQQ